MAAQIAVLPPEDEPPTDNAYDDRWEFEPDPDETFQVDPEEDRKWEAFLLDDDGLEPRQDEFVPL